MCDRYVPIGLQLFAQNRYAFRPVQSGLMLVSRVAEGAEPAIS